MIRSGPTPRSSPRRSSSSARRSPSACTSSRSSTRASRSCSSTSASAEGRETFKANGGLVDFVKYLAQGKDAVNRSSRSRPRHRRWRGRDRDAVDHGYTESVYSFANTINTHEGGMHEEGLKKSLTNVLNRYARAEGPPEGEGRQPDRRGRARGPRRDHLGEAARPAVRGTDEDEARQRLDALARRDHRERPVLRVARGAPRRRQAHLGEGLQRGQGPARGPAGARPHAAQVLPRERVAAGQARRLPADRPRRAASCTSSRATRPAAPRRARATVRRRRSCRSGARS